MLTDAWVPNAFISSVSDPEQNGHSGERGSAEGASRARSSAS